MDALAPYRVAGPDQDPAPLAHLQTKEPWAFDVNLWVELESNDMTRSGIPPTVISRTNFSGMYWTVVQ